MRMQIFHEYDLMILSKLYMNANIMKFFLYDFKGHLKSHIDTIMIKNSFFLRYLFFLSKLCIDAILKMTSKVIQLSLLKVILCLENNF